MSNATTLPQVAQKLDDYVTTVIGSEKLTGFGRAFQMSQAIAQLKQLLTAEYMKPIMQLQGTKLGFRTDKDKSGGYPVEVVQSCLIEAVLMGLQPTGNQFNIIAGNCYPTKEGCGYLLSKIHGLKYSIVTGLPRINTEKTSCAFDIKIWWSLNGMEQTAEVPKPIKIDQYASVDSMVGKAERKARAWLLSRITGFEVTDGEVEDTTHTVMGSKPLQKSKEEIETERVQGLVNSATTMDELHFIRTQNPTIDTAIFDKREDELKKK